jgi:hypothetical protein
MSPGFSLKSSVQFHDLDQKRDQWISVKSQPLAQLRFEDLIGSRWGRLNCALDDPGNSDLWNADILDEDRAQQFDHHSKAAGRLISLVQSKRILLLQDLLELHGLMLSGNSETGELRNSWIQPLTNNHHPPECELLTQTVENALEWFGSESFHEIHEVEQAALFLARLLDILPFQQQNGRTLRLAANFFLLRAGFPPAFIPPSRTGQYSVAIEKALRLETQSLVDLWAGSLLESLLYCLGETPTPSAFQILA